MPTPIPLMRHWLCLQQRAFSPPTDGWTRWQLGTTFRLCLLPSTFFFLLPDDPVFFSTRPSTELTE